MLMGLDASTTCTGVGIYNNDKQLIKCGAIKPPQNDGDWRDRIRIIGHKLKDLINKYQIDTIVIENVPKEQKNIATLQKLCVLQGFLTCIADEHNCRMIYYDPNQWRSKMELFDGTRKGTQRKEMKAKAIAKANELFDLGLTEKQDDIAEAVLIGYTYFKED